MSSPRRRDFAANPSSQAVDLQALALVAPTMSSAVDVRVGTWSDDGTLHVWDDSRCLDRSVVQLFELARHQSMTFERRLVEATWVDRPHKTAVEEYAAWCIEEQDRLRAARAAQRARFEQESRLATEFARRKKLEDEESARWYASRAMASRRHFGVFSRNHRGYLEHAAQAGENDPGRHFTFRSGFRWVAVRDALNDHGPVPIVFAVIDGPPSVRYEALLEYVLLDPERGDSETEEILEFELRGRHGWGTRGEGLWSRTKPVRTLYVISGCHRIARTPIGLLRRWNSRAFLSEDYRHAYALIRWKGPVPARKRARI